jgi:hypothetical protein
MPTGDTHEALSWRRSFCCFVSWNVTVASDALDMVVVVVAADSEAATWVLDVSVVDQVAEWGADLWVATWVAKARPRYFPASAPQ